MDAFSESRLEYLMEQIDRSYFKYILKKLNMYLDNPFMIIKTTNGYQLFKHGIDGAIVYTPPLNFDEMCLVIERKTYERINRYL